jgi:hypothetical protein
VTPVRPWLLVAVLLMLGGGCAAPGSSSEPLSTRLASAKALPPELQRIVAAARADASARTAAPASTFDLVSAQAVTWRDGSIGCPRPGMAYAQALVPGWRIRLRGAGGELDYHAARPGTLLLCPAGAAAEPLPDSRD